VATLVGLVGMIVGPLMCVVGVIVCEMMWAKEGIR
jgi:predicted PurR-regulated permease PerM